MNGSLSFYECTFSDGYTQTLSAAIELFEGFAVTGCTKTSSSCSLTPSCLLPPKSNLGRGRSRIPVGRGANLLGEPTYKFARFSQKCMKLRKLWSGVGGLGRRAAGTPLDQPLLVKPLQWRFSQNWPTLYSDIVAVAFLICTA